MLLGISGNDWSKSKYTYVGAQHAVWIYMSLELQLVHEDDKNV